MTAIWRARHCLALIIVVASAVGCGCSAQVSPSVITTAPPSPETIDTLLVSIDQQLGIMAGGGACLDRCRAAASICDSAERICVIARDLAEVEAMESCRRSEDHCTEAQRVVNDECSCP